MASVVGIPYHTWLRVSLYGCPLLVIIRFLDQLGPPRISAPAMASFPPGLPLFLFQNAGTGLPQTRPKSGFFRMSLFILVSVPCSFLGRCFLFLRRRREALSGYYDPFGFTTGGFPPLPADRPTTPPLSPLASW